ncbi:MAG: hypothetical protein KatS3mg016_1893 [Fimbriimonadales bacterium]|jgi:hypothetical protein|nr:MAG: hypothetical protein KatS3mg016_1893 [Fimbriimonadales bacterium]
MLKKLSVYGTMVMAGTLLLLGGMVYSQNVPLPLPILPPCASCDSDTQGWNRVNGSIDNLCCIDSDGDGRYHCAMCILDRYEKTYRGQRLVKYAGPHSCRAVTPLMPCL